MLRAFILSAAVVAFSGGAHAATLSLVSPDQLVSQSKLFTTEWKRDKTASGGEAGHDVFLRNGEETAGPSFNVNWGASGTSYDWSLGYDGAVATLVFNGVERTLDVNPDGNWNAIQFFIRADSARFDTSTATVSILNANGADLSTPLTQFAMDGQFGGIFALAGFETITSLSGTMVFDFVFADGATGSPNSTLAINVKALEVAPVPLPAAAWMLIAGLGALGALGRRRAAA